MLQSQFKTEGGEAEDSKERDVQYGNEMFSISTEWAYLYLLGKISIKFNLDMRGGVEVLCDCAELMRLLGCEGCKMFYKAKYWVAYALLTAGHKLYID